VPRVYGKGNIKEIAIDERLRLGWRRCRGQACKHGGQQRGWQGPDRNGRREGPPCQENGADTQLQSPCQHTSKVSSHLGNQPVPAQFPRSMPAVTWLHARGPASCRACSCPGLEGDSREEGSFPRRGSCPVVHTPRGSNICCDPQSKSIAPSEHLHPAIAIHFNHGFPALLLSIGPSQSSFDRRQEVSEDEREDSDADSSDDDRLYTPLDPAP